MRPLALVLVITLVGSCVPVPTKTHAYVGNAIWMAASTYVFIAADNRSCDYVSNEPDPWSAGLDTAIVNIGCETGRSIEMETAEAVMVLAVGGIVRTLINTYQGPATRTSRSR